MVLMEQHSEQKPTMNGQNTNGFKVSTHIEITACTVMRFIVDALLQLVHVCVMLKCEEAVKMLTRSYSAQYIDIVHRHSPNFLVIVYTQ